VGSGASLGVVGEEKSLLPMRGSQMLDCQAHSVVTTLTELFQLL
jgi:hypothetical protein